MATKRGRKATQMSPEQYAQWQHDQALERRKRGLPTFTDATKREAVLGSTAGENTLQSGHRITQVNQRPRKRSR